MDVAFLLLTAALAAVTDRSHLRFRASAGKQMSTLYVVCTLVTAGLFVYLVAAMLKPEWFE